MTTNDVSHRPATAAGRAADVRALSDLLPRFMRMATAHKAQLVSEGRERAALMLLFPLARTGPCRQSTLAETVHADPSTVSRHVAALVERGLVGRVADESDGRASRLVVTEAGQRAMNELCAERENHLGQAMAHWSADDLTTFTRLFGRLIDDLETALPGAPGCGAPHPSGPITSPIPATRRTR